VGPLLGGAMASLFYEYVFLDDGKKLKGIGENLSSMYKKAL